MPDRPVAARRLQLADTHSGARARPHVFSVYAVDQAGNADETPETRSFSVVTSTPGSGTPVGGSSGGVGRRPCSQRRYRCRTSSHPRSRACGSSPAVSGRRGRPGARGARRHAGVVDPVEPAVLPGWPGCFGPARGRPLRTPSSGERPPAQLHAGCAAAASLVRTVPAGLSSLRYRGRLGGRALKPGRYRLIVRGRDALGTPLRTTPGTVRDRALGAALGALVDQRTAADVHDGRGHAARPVRGGEDCRVADVLERRGP